jgi:hypothetical protein
MIDGKINHQYMIHGFYGQDIVQTEKLVLIVDNIHAELIFTNGRFSVSCFYDESRFLAGRVNSVTQLAFIDNAVYNYGEYYNLHKLGFLANSYTLDLPNLNAAIRQYDDLLFDSFGIKRETDSAFNSAISDIYTIMSESILSFEKYLTSYIPTFVRQSPPKSMFDSSRNRELARHRVSVYEDYDRYVPDDLSNWTMI